MAKMYLSLSYTFQCMYFLKGLMYRSYSSGFWISLRGNCFVYSCAFDVYVKGMNLGASSVAFLVKSVQVGLL